MIQPAGQREWCIKGPHGIQREQVITTYGIELEKVCQAYAPHLQDHINTFPAPSTRASPIPGGAPSFRDSITVDSSYRRPSLYTPSSLDMTISSGTALR